jgi:deoxyribose-phosphate aldolase
MEHVLDRIEHTELGPTTAWPDVAGALDAAIRYGTRACIPPWAVAAADDYAPSVALTTVVGFPEGQHATGTKVDEATTAQADGAAEIDLVPNHGRLLAGDDEAYEDEIAEVVAAVSIPVKVIVESDLLDPDDLERACEAAAAADAAFVKTATGIVAGGATVEAVETMADYLPVKASGGITSWEEAEAMLEAGAERIGASSGDVIAEEYRAASETVEEGGDEEAGESVDKEADESGDDPA